MDAAFYQSLLVKYLPSSKLKAFDKQQTTKGGHMAYIVKPELELKQLVALVKFLECSHKLAVDTSLFTDQEAAAIGQGYLSLRAQLEEFKND